MINQESLYEIFAEESRELVVSLENDLLELENDFQNEELINDIFRSVHTIKGSSGMVEYDILSDFAHEFEDVLSRVRSKELKVTKALISLFLEAVDVLKKLIETEQKKVTDDILLDIAKVKEALQKYRGIETEKQTSVVIKNDKNSEKYIEIIMKLAPNIFFMGTDPLMLLKEIEENGEIIRIKCDYDVIPELENLKFESLYLSWTIILKTSKPFSDIENIFIFVMDDENTIKLNDVSERFVNGVDIEYADKKIGEILEEEGLINEKDFEAVLKEQKKAGEILVAQNKIDETSMSQVLKKQEESKKQVSSSSIRVNTDKLDKLVNFVGEMVISVARMTQLISDFHERFKGNINRDLDDTIESLERISRDVQEQVMRVRMVPVGPTFKRFKRMVRDTAMELGKKIDLLTEGTNTEVDKNIIEHIADPLKHLIRNSVDHGIESPEERINAGKPVEGSIWLRAYQQEGKIVIEVEDDGHGIDSEKVLQKAIEKGLYKGGDITENEIYSFIMMPGFSTAETVTDISGRGVGMDVVRKNIEDLRGNIEIFSEKGSGTLFRIKLPLTLAIIDGMKVSVGEEILTIPLLSIVEAIRLPSKDIVKTIEGKGELIEFRNQYLPFIRLYEIFNLETKIKEPKDSVVMIIEENNKTFAVMVDDVIGQQQAVIKSMEANYKQIDGISGATILGNGNVSLILDVHGLEKLIFEEKK